MYLMWIGFIGLIAVLLALDLGVFHRRAQVVRLKAGLGWSAVWIALAFAFCGLIYAAYEYQWMGLGTSVDAADGTVNDGGSAAVKFLTGYLVEKSLSVDNIFVIALLFASLRIPQQHQHRVLFWGIVGAMALRGILIGVGSSLINHFHWLIYIFGGFLIVTAAKLLLSKDTNVEHGQNRMVKRFERWFPFTSDLHGSKFAVRRDGRRLLTPLALALLAVEATDVVFAMDSIPAIFAVTTDPFLVFTSNIFAILGLRSLYFALAGLMEWFKYLKVSLAVILAVVGGKMLAGHWLKDVLGSHGDLWLLFAVAGILACGVVASLLARRPGRTASTESRDAVSAGRVSTPPVL